MNKFKSAVGGAMVCGVCFVNQGVSQTLVDCVSPASDTDGDGYGWENNQSCIVVVQEQGQCEDRGGYPWGWNPQALTSCRLDVDVLPTECVDTDPKNDGWGWNGITSCPISIKVDVHRCDFVGGVHWGWNPTLNSTCRLELVDTPDPSIPLWMLPTIPLEELQNIPMSCKRVTWQSQFENNPLVDLIEGEQDLSRIFFTATLRGLSQLEVMKIEGSWEDVYQNDVVRWDRNQHVVGYSIEQISEPFPSGTLRFHRVDQYIAISQTEGYFDVSEFITSYCVPTNTDSEL